MRTPLFWLEDPELWFAHLEEQFDMSGITQDSMKYSHVLSHLKLRYSREIRDVITSTREGNKYLAIKNALIQRLTVSQEQRLRQPLEHKELGDRKPSQFLRHLQTLAGNSTFEQLLRSMWLRRLPSQIQVILATRVQDPLRSQSRPTASTK